MAADAWTLFDCLLDLTIFGCWFELQLFALWVTSCPSGGSECF